MIITGKRKHKLDKQLLRLPGETIVIPGVPLSTDLLNVVSKIGFSDSLSEGETVLPPSSLGPICRYNAEGREIVQKNQPMETAYRQAEWTWKQWSGRYYTETMSKIVDIPYKRYPRSFIPPPSIELSIAINIKGEKYIVSKKQKLDFCQPEDLLHSINLFLEIFNQCQVLTKDLNGYSITNIKQMNWRILPPGKYPWEKFQGQLKPIIEKEKEQKQIVVRHRLELITGYDPEFVAFGRAGFSGYLIFGFPRKSLYVLESLNYGNATYIFEEEWETLSRLTKAEILTGNFQKDRIIHRVQWDGQVKKLLN